jgi:hypothetical protein
VTDRDTLRMRFRIANPVPDPDTVVNEELDQVLFTIESEWDRLRGLASPSRAPGQVRRSRLVPVLVFAAAALLLLLAVGLPMLFLNGGGDLSPIDETTTVQTTTATTVPPTTVATTVPPIPATTEAPQAVSAPPMTWERVPHRPAFEGAAMWTVVAGGPGLVAGGWVGDLWSDGPAQGAVFASADGVEWERIEDPSFGDGVTVLAVGPDSTLVAFGCDRDDTQPILVSQNGRDWDRIYSDLFGPGCRVGAQSVTAGGPGFVAVGNTVTDDAAVWLSEDGRDWIQVSDDALIATKEDDRRLKLMSVTEGGPGLVAIGGVGAGGNGGAEFDAMGVWVSEDGTDWERLPNLDDQWPGYISRDPVTGRLIAFGTDMWTSDNGFEWTQHEQQSPDNQPSEATLAWDGERVVAGGPGRNTSLWASGDRGESWSRIDPDDRAFAGSPAIHSVTRFGDAFVAVGIAGAYMEEVAAVWVGSWDE